MKKINRNTGLLFVLQLIFILLMNQCTETSNKNDLLIDTDSVKFYTEFDYYEFKPIGSLNNRTKEFPYVEMVYSGKGTIEKIASHYKEGIINRFFTLEDSNYIMTREYYPEPNNSYSISYFSKGEVLSYCFDCSTKVDYSDYKNISDSACWLSSIAKLNKFVKVFYHFTEEDTLPKYSIGKIDTAHDFLINHPNLMGYKIDSIFEIKDSLFQTIYLYTLKDKDTTVYRYKYLIDSIYSINWLDNSP